jgi:hypothetical protein
MILGDGVFPDPLERLKQTRNIKQGILGTHPGLMDRA